MKFEGLEGYVLIGGDTNLDGLAIKSLSATRILVYCNGVYLLVEIFDDGVGVFTRLARVILDLDERV